MGKIISINGIERNAESVILHSVKRRKRGKKASLSYYGVSNPKWALLYAIYSNKFGTEGIDGHWRGLCFALFEEGEPVEVPEYALVVNKEYNEYYAGILERLLNEPEEDPFRKYKFVAILDFSNSLVVALGNDAEEVLAEAARRGVPKPVLVTLSIEPIPSISL